MTELQSSRSIASVRVLGPCGPNPAPLPLPALGFAVSCGFPSPAEDYLDDDLDLSARCITNPPATFFATAEGDSMQGFGIYAGDTLIVDRSIDAKDGDIALMLFEGGLMVKKLRFRRNSVELVSGSQQHANITVQEGHELQVWGVITWSFRKHLRR